MYTVPVAISSPRFVRTWLHQTPTNHPVFTGRSALMKVETTSIGRSEMASLIRASSAHCLGYAGRHYTTTRFSISFGTRVNYPHSRSLCLSDRRRSLVKCMHTLVSRVPQEHRSMLSVSITVCEYQNLALINVFAHLVAGPDRPIPQPKEPTSTSTSPGSNQPYADRAGATKDSLASGANDLYSRLGSAMSERGQMLDGLEDTVNSLRAGSENMVAQVGLLRLQVLPFHLLTATIGEEACCRTVDARMVQLLSYSTPGVGGRLRLWGTVGEWKYLRNGRSAFSCTFLRGWTSKS